MDILSVLKHPSMLHSAAVHLPIALALMGMLLLVGCAIFQKSSTLRWLTLLNYVIMMASLQYGLWTGENARDLVPNDLPTQVWNIVDQHEEMAEWVWWSGLFTLVFVGLALVPHIEVRKGLLLIASFGGLVSLLLVSVTAHYGGSLVYLHGVGTPLMHAAKPVAVVPPAEQAVVAPPVATTPTPEVPAPDAAMTIPSPVAPVEPVSVPADTAPATPPPPAEAPGPDAATTPPTETPTVTAPPAPAEEPLVEIRPLDPEAAKLVDFQRDIWPIVEQYCIDCHESPELDGGYDMSTVATMLLPGEKSGPGVIPGDPDGSSIVQYIRGEKKPRMPRKEPALEADVLHTIRLWILAGAKESAAAE